MHSGTEIPVSKEEYSISISANPRNLRETNHQNLCENFFRELHFFDFFRIYNIWRVSSPHFICQEKNWKTRS